MQATASVPVAVMQAPEQASMDDTYDELLALLADSPEQAEPAQPQPQIPPRPQPELPPQPQPLPEQLSYDDISDLIK